MLIASEPRNGEVSILIDAKDANVIAHGLTEAATAMGKSGHWNEAYVREMSLLASVFNLAFYAVQTAPVSDEPAHIDGILADKVEVES